MTLTMTLLIIRDIRDMR